MTRRKTKPTPQKLDEPRQVSPEMRARMDSFVRALGHMILVKIDPEPARHMAEGTV